MRFLKSCDTMSTNFSLNQSRQNASKNIKSEAYEHIKKKCERKCKLLTKVVHQSSLILRPRLSLSRSQRHIRKYASMHDLLNTNKWLKSDTGRLQGRVKNLNTVLNYNAFQLEHLNLEYDYHSISNFNSYIKQKKWKVYRCQLSTTRESCCCSCNSDAMFEVMKGLYDCYKMKNCNHCNCVLCGHLQRDERRIGEIVRSLASVGLDTTSAKKRKELTKQAEKAMVGKPLSEKEKILKDLAASGAPLPKGKTASEKSLIRKIRRDLGLPPEPKTASIKSKMKEAAKVGLLTPLEGKTNAQKQKILEGLHDMGIPLPEGRTASEKSLIAKIAKQPRKSSFLTPSEKKRKAKDESLIKPLDGKTPKQKEKILRSLAHQGLPLPKGKTESEKNLINKVRADLGLPPEPKTQAMRDKHVQASDVGLLLPLEGRSPKEKEIILRGLHNMEIPLPEGRTPSEKALIAKVAAEPRMPLVLSPSEKIRKAKDAGLLTPLQGKTPEQKEKILKGLAEHGITLPEGKTASEKKLLNKIRNDLGLPPEPKDSAMRKKYVKAADAGLIKPLEGKSPKEKKKILQGLHTAGIPLPIGRTPSEKSLIAKIEAEPVGPSLLTPSGKIRKTKLTGLMTPLEGKTPDQKAKILKRLAEHGIPLPEGKTASEKKALNKIRDDLGLPPEPKNSNMRNKYAHAAAAGLLKPLKGKSPKEKEKILRGLHDLGIPLPKGQTPSDKVLIDKIAAEPRVHSILAPSEKIRRAKAAGLLTPLENKTPEQKENILKGLAKHGLPLPEGKTLSENKLLDKIRADLGLPPEPKTPAMRDKYTKAANAGLLQPIKGKTPTEKKKFLRGLHNIGIPLPEGRTPSEKALVNMVAAEPQTFTELTPSDQISKAREAGLLTPLQGKSPEHKEKILKGLANLGLPLPEGKTTSEKKLTDKVRADLGIPPEPKTPTIREKHAKAADAGLLQPLEGKTPKEKKHILRGLHDMAIPLPEGRTPSEKSLIAKIAKEPRTVPILSPAEKIRKAKTAGLLTPLQGKSPEQKENLLKGLADLGLPLPEGKTESDKIILDKIRKDLGLPPEPKTLVMRDKYAKAADAGLMQPLQGKSPKEKKNILRGLRNMGISLPEGRTHSEKSLIAKIAKEPRTPSLLAPSEKIRKAKAAGLLTPLQGKTPQQKENILKGLADLGLPLPEGKTSSEKKLLDTVRKDLGLPPEPKTAVMRDKYAKATDAGLMKPLQGKLPDEKKNILRGLHNMGIPLPEGRTPSEESLIAKIAKEPRTPSILAPSEKIRKAKAAGLLTPIQGKSPEQKENILKGLGYLGLPLPEGKTTSEKKLLDKVRKDLGLPPEPKTPAMREKYMKAADAGLMQPLQGKLPEEKKNILRGLHNMGIPLPEGQTPSEKSIIAKITKEPRIPSILAPAEKLRKAKAAGLLTPIQGKSPEQKENILKGLGYLGLPLPEGKTTSEKKLLDKVRKELGLPPEPKTPAMRDKYMKAADAGLMQPLQGKLPEEKKNILRGLHNMGIPLPEGQTPSEKSLITKITKEPRIPSILAPTEKLRKAKAAGLLTPIQGKSPEQKENILKGLADLGLPLPEGKTASEKKLLDKVRTDLGLPPEPKTPAMRDKYAKAADAGLMQPLQNKSPEQKKNILRGLHNNGILLPEGRTRSEKSLIAKIEQEPRELILTPAQKIREAKAAGLLTPLQGKTLEQKEKVLKGIANLGLPLPEGKTPSEKNLIHKVRANVGLPPEPKTQAMRDKYAKAADAGLLQPLEGKTLKEKKNILRGLHHVGIPLPEGRTSSEKSLIAKVAAEPRTLPVPVPSKKILQANAAGLLTPLKGKTPKEKEKILRGLAKLGFPLPEGKSPSEKDLVEKVRADLGLPPEPKTPSLREKYIKAADAGLLKPLEGKSPKEKTKILRGLHNMGIPLPEGRTPSERALVAKIAVEPRVLSLLAPSEKLRKAKAAGLLTPLHGKTPDQKEKILRGLAKHGLPLPEGKTASEKKLLNKVRTDLGLPPEPETPVMREKHVKAADAGLLQPLEGKSPKEKKKLLRGLQYMGIPLPEGRTPSEKSLISKIAAEPRKFSLIAPSEKLRKAMAAGLITPLEGKLPEEKEKILKGLAERGLPLPEGKTTSEKKLLNKVRLELGLPPEPQTQDMREKHAKAANAGLLLPLEGKSKKEKEKILKGLAEMNIPLPEGRTPSEKALISKIKAAQNEIRKLDEKTAKLMTEGKGPSDECICDLLTREFEEVPHLPSITTEKIQKAKKEGLFTPLHGKSPEEKEKILKKLAAAGLPLPRGITPSEKSLIKHIKDQFGIPEDIPVEKIRKAKAAGLLTPLDGKTPAQKEKILRGRVAAGLPLPKGKTPSENDLIKKIKESTGYISPSPSERIRKAEVAGLLTPLTGKTPEHKEKILKDLLQAGVHLPEGKTSSEKKILAKVRADTGLPPEPRTPSLKEKYKNAEAAGIITPLEGKTPAEKEKILNRLHNAGIPLPEGRSPSEKALINTIKAKIPKPSTLSQRVKAAKAAGLLTPLQGKTPKEKEKILKGLLQAGVPLPEGKTPSERKLINNIRAEVGLPPEPKTPSIKEKYNKAISDGLITPLEGKTPLEKVSIIRKLHDAGIPLPEGRSPSEKSMIKKAKAGLLKSPTPSQKLRKAKAAGLLTPLEGKTPGQKKKILKNLLKAGVPLPEGKTPSDKNLIAKIRSEFGLPHVPETPSLKEKYKNAEAAGLVTPLEGKTPRQKENILRKLHAAGIPLPEGRSLSEKAIVKKVKAGLPKPATPSQRLKAAKAAGLLTPLEGKTPEQKAKILKGMIQAGVPLPEGKTPSEKKLINKIRAEIGLPPEPKTPSMKEKYAKALVDGIITPLEDKTPAEKANILQKLYDAGLPLPEGRTASEKAIIKKAKAGLLKPVSPLIPLEGKTPNEKKKILKDLLQAGIPLPEGKTPSEKELMEEVRKETGLPPSPKTPSLKEKYEKATADGIITPLDGKTPAEKENVLKKLQQAGIPFPEGRSPSEKAMIKKIKVGPTLSQRLRTAKAAGLLTPLEGKTPEQKANILKRMAQAGVPLPEGKTPSEQKLINKIRNETGLPPQPETLSMKEKYDKALADGIVTPLEGKTPKEKEKIIKKLLEVGLPIPEGRTPSEKSMIKKIKSESPRLRTPSQRLKTAKTGGFLTPLEGKTPEQKEKILKGLARAGVPLPKGKTPSEKKMINKIRAETGLPPEPKSPSMKEKYDKALADGIITPLEGKTHEEKKKVIKNLLEAGLPLPKGRTPSEKSMIKKIKAGPTLSQRLKAAKAAGLLTPLEGKTSDQKSKILKGMALTGVPLPEGKTPSEKKVIDKIRAEMGLPPESKTPSMKEKYDKALADGIIMPLEGKTTAEKEKILKQLLEAGIPFPVGRTPSEKALIKKIKAEPPKHRTPSQRLKAAKAAGVLTPLEGKTPEQKEKILKGLARSGLPLPEGNTPSEKKLIDRIRAETGLPPEPKSPSMKEKYDKALADGIITPLEGKTPAEKEKILRMLLEAGLPLPEGRTPSEKALIKKIKAETRKPRTPSQRLKAAKAAGVLTPLEGKTPEQKVKILKGLVQAGIPLPEGKTPSEKKLINKIRDESGLPPEPKSPSMKEKYDKALADGFITPLEGKTPAEKEKILRMLFEAGLPLPEGRTPSEKALIKKIKAETRKPRTPSQRLKAAKVAGVLTPLEGKTPEQKEKKLKGLVQAGIPLPEGKTPSEKKLINKIRDEVGLPPEPKSPSMKEKYDKALADGIITPLEGKTPAEKENVLRTLLEAGLPLPEGRTPSEKNLIKKIKAERRKLKTQSQRLKAAKAAGVLTPLEGKTPAQKEKILKGLVKAGVPLPEGKTPSDKRLISKIRNETGLPPDPKSPSMKEKYDKALADGIITPLEDKTPAEKEQILRNLQASGITFPEGRTPSEKALIKKLEAESPKTPTLSQRKRAAKAAGFLTPLTGKSPDEKERILKGLINAGLPLPKGKTKSEKSLIRKVKDEAGLPTRTIGVGEEAKDIISKAGIAEELEEIKKTTVCDHACGCDKKKIRFKHSYVKIRVTSPDISSFCPCPEECIPRVKNGVFVDNEGIKVTIGSVVSVPSYFRISAEGMSQYSKENAIGKPTFLSDRYFRSDWRTEEPFNLKNNVFKRLNNEDSLKYILATRHVFNSSASENSCQTGETSELKNLSSSELCLESSTYFKTPDDFFGIPGSIHYNNYMLIESVPKTSDSILIFESETSISFTTSCDSTGSSSSIISVTDDSDVFNTTSNFNPLSDVLINVECFDSREDK